MATIRRHRHTLAYGLCTVTLLLSAISAMAAEAVEKSSSPIGLSRTLQPNVESARGGKCVADPAFMRRNHMDLLKHQRDDTMRGGIRTGAYSLKACIDCHASQTTGSVSADNSNFCQSCHRYAAVTIDCFECHSNKPQPARIDKGPMHGIVGEPRQTPPTLPKVPKS